jgi:hypothetical protein
LVPTPGEKKVPLRRAQVAKNEAKHHFKAKKQLFISASSLITTN